MLYALLAYPDRFRECSRIWFIENVPGLMSLVKGRSRVEDMDVIRINVHMLLFNLRCRIFFEYIESGVNWSDSISRLGMWDPTTLQRPTSLGPWNSLSWTPSPLCTSSPFSQSNSG